MDAGSAQPPDHRLAAEARFRRFGCKRTTLDGITAEAGLVDGDSRVPLDRALTPLNQIVGPGLLPRHP